MAKFKSKDGSTHHVLSADGNSTVMVGPTSSEVPEGYIQNARQNDALQELKGGDSSKKRSKSSGKKK